MLVMRDLRNELAAEGIELWTARLKTRVRETVERTGALEFGHVFATVRVAVRTFQDGVDRAGPAAVSDDEQIDES